MKLMVTGGSGFIGRNIVESLSKNHAILAPGHDELDLTDSARVNEYFRVNDIDVVIHGAVKPGHRNIADPTRLLYANTRMFFNIIRNSDRFQRMIFLGSGADCDIRANLEKVGEDFFDTFVPEDEHGFSKYIIAKYIHGLDNVTYLRLFGVFGKYEDYAIRFISNAICKTLFGLPITIRQNRRFDYLFIDDLMPVLEYFIQNNGKYTSYNVTPDKSAELFEIAEIVKLRSGKDLPIIVSMPGMGTEYSGANDRLHEQIAGLRLTPLHAAIDRLYAWYEGNVNLIEKDKLLHDK